MEITVNPTPEVIAVVAGALMAVLFNYVPGLAGWFAKLDSTYKRLFMLGAAIITVGAIFGLACANIVVGIACDKYGALRLVLALFLWVMSNQSADRISPVVGEKAKALHK